MNEQESAWEPEERLDSFGCETSGCHQPATWRLRGHPGNSKRAYESADWQEQLTRWFTANPIPHWVCDAHKVEPQPPSYEEWLTKTEVSS